MCVKLKCGWEIVWSIFKLTFSWWRSLSYRNQSWTGFYMIWPSAMIEFNQKKRKMYFFRSLSNIYDGQKQPPHVFYIKGVLKKFAIFTGKHLCWSLFLTILQACSFITKRLQHMCFLVKFAKFLRTTKRFYERLLLELLAEIVTIYK